MDKRTVASAHDRIDGLEKEVVAIKPKSKSNSKICLVVSSGWKQFFSALPLQSLVY
jgi:hypothetical protein